MKLHVFNPEHDLALAFGGSNFTSPRAGRQLRSDLSFLPVLWADEGDFVLVGDVSAARSALGSLPAGVLSALPRVVFVTPSSLRSVLSDAALDGVMPWGWDAAIARELVRCGVSENMLPSAGQLNAIREISNRRWAALHLGNTGVWCDSLAMLKERAAALRRFVLKAPWSSSGRGVRYDPNWQWAAKIIERQGGIMIESYMEKVVDFGMEFHSMPLGEVVYDGLSLFETSGSAYTGNILASEEEKEALLARHIDVEQLSDIRRNIIVTMSEALRNIYAGPFGVDMMVYESEGRKHLAPCVELNLRRTMGHVALALYNLIARQGEPSGGAMRITFDGHSYRLVL